MAKNLVFVARAKDTLPPQTEALAGAAGILPGMLLIKSSGALIPHNVDGQSGMAYIANLNATVQDQIDDVYTNGETVNAFEPRPHDYFHMRIASGVNITAKDTPLTSNGDGYLRIALTDGTEEVVAYADEVADFSSAAGLLRVKIGNAGYNADTTA